MRNRKVIQISTHLESNGIGTGYVQAVYALCDDGRVFRWALIEETGSYEWQHLADVPQGELND